ncbi:MAG: hypothetical protein VX498_10450 [Myxococcota bacterium]|nr:hypothetical protein [Myxococcota bacterium]
MSLRHPRGEPHPAALPAVTRCSGRAVRAWRRLRALKAAAGMLPLSLLAMIATVAYLEVGQTGLEPGHLGLLALWLLLPALSGLRPLLRPVEAAQALAELDARSSMADRLGTAWEFVGDDAELAKLQRRDAEAHAAGLDVEAAFVFEPKRVPLIALLACLFLVCSGGALLLDLTPDAVPDGPRVEDDGAVERLLESIGRDSVRFTERGDKRAVALLTDLERKIREIEEREEALQPEDDEGPAGPSEEDAAKDDPDEPMEPSEDRITVEDLERLEAEFMEQIRLSDAQEAELVSQLFQRTKEATRLVQRLEEHIHDEHAVSFGGAGQPSFQPGQEPHSPFEGLQTGEGMTGNASVDSNLASIGNPIEEDMDLYTRDLSEESLNEHERVHDTQESFNQFLREFVKDLQQVAAEQATGRKRKRNRDKPSVKVDSGQGVADRSGAQSERGLEELGAQKRDGARRPPEQLGGAPDADAKPAGEQQGSGPLSDNAMAIKGPSDGTTSPGASGAGSQADTSAKGLKTMLQDLSELGDLRIDQLPSLGSGGRLSSEERAVLFQQVARLKVQVGSTGEDDDVTVDYFDEAEELLVSNRSSLPPLFRDYAHNYFEAIRPPEDESEER